MHGTEAKMDSPQLLNITINKNQRHYIPHYKQHKRSSYIYDKNGKCNFHLSHNFAIQMARRRYFLGVYREAFPAFWCQKTVRNISVEKLYVIFDAYHSDLKTFLHTIQCW